MKLYIVWDVDLCRVARNACVFAIACTQSDALENLYKRNFIVMEA